jgi:hypothetical protein
MGVISPERPQTPASPPPGPPEPPPREPRRPPRFPFGLVALGLAIVAILYGANWVRGIFPSFDVDNPFRAETVDRSGPAVLKSLRDLREYRAASGQFEQIVDVEKDTSLPSFILGERTLFVAVGTVDAVVDFSTVGSGAIEVSDDRRTATITLPRPTFSEVSVDPARSYVYDRDEGFLNEAGRLFTDDPNRERELYLLAERKIMTSAQQGSGLLARAEENTRAMLQSMLGALGFTAVDVRFE